MWLSKSKWKWTLNRIDRCEEKLKNQEMKYKKIVFEVAKRILKQPEGLLEEIESIEDIEKMIRRVTNEPLRYDRKEVRRMGNNYYSQVEINDKKLNEIFERLTKAQNEIQECYFKLKALNVIKQTSSNASEEKDYSESDSKSHQMNREEMLKITYELLQVLNDKKVSPNDAKSIAYMFQKEVTEGNDARAKEYMETEVFHKELPKN